MQVSTTTLSQAFNIAFNKATKVAFSKEFDNGTGYFNEVSLMGTEEGSPFQDEGVVYAFETLGGRKAIVWPDQGGNIVLFQRYSNQADVFCYHKPKKTRFGVSAGGEALSDKMVPIFFEALTGDEIAVSKLFAD